MNDRLSEIEARANAATPGPWTEFDGGDCYEYADLDFIRASREDIPWLIEEVKRLRKGLTALADPNNYDAGGDWWGSDRNMPDWSGAYAQNILDGGQP